MTEAVMDGAATTATTTAADTGATPAQNLDLATQNTAQEGEQQTETTTAEPTEAEKLTAKHAKELARMERRIGRVTAARYAAEAEATHLRNNVRQPETEREEGETGEQKTPDPRQLQAEISRAARAQVEAERFTAKCNDVYEQGMKASPKFAAAFKAVSDEVGGLITDQGPSSLMAVLLDSDVATHKLIQHLADNPDVAAELADMSPTRQAKRIALIEHEMKAPKPTKQASDAAKPIKPVSPAASSGAPDPSDTKAWIEWRNKQKG